MGFLTFSLCSVVIGFPPFFICSFSWTPCKVCTDSNTTMKLLVTIVTVSTVRFYVSKWYCLSVWKPSRHCTLCLPSSLFPPFPSPPPSFMKLSYCTVTVWTICLRMTSFTFKKHLFLFRLLNHNPFAFGGNIHKNWNESLELLHAVIVQHQVYVGRPSYWPVKYLVMSTCTD